MALAVPHDQVRKAEDRGWTLALLDEVRSASVSEADRGTAFDTLAWLEDYRSIAPLTEMVEDVGLGDSVREAASRVLRGFDDSTTSESRRAWWGSGDPVKMAHALGLMDRSEADVIVAIAGDDHHPLQPLALAVMAFGFDEAEYQPVKIRALVHPAAAVREAAAAVIVWDEPVAAEGPLLRAATDASSKVAAAAAETLQYYPSRRVLRALAELAKSNDEQVRVKAAESLDYNRGRFEFAATFGDREQVMLLREWMKPVADLVAWPAEIQDREDRQPPRRQSRTELAVSDVLSLIADPNGGWAAKKQTLRRLKWDAYVGAERERLAHMLTTHPDPIVREIAAVPLAAWTKSHELLGLTSDASFSVRKSAIYFLASVPRDPAIGRASWEYMQASGGTTAQEALRTYAAHASESEAMERLVELALTDRRECIKTTAIALLVDLRAAAVIEKLVPLLDEPPGVSWAVHIQVLNGFRSLQLRRPDLDELATTDNLDLVQSIVAAR